MRNFSFAAFGATTKIAVLGLIGIVGGSAFAADPSSATVCVGKFFGEVRVIQASGRCTIWENKVTWNFGGGGSGGGQGAPGPAGPAGPAGAPGPAGPAGAAGGLQVVDRDGKAVGTLIGLNTLSLKIGSDLVSIANFGTSGFQSVDVGSFQFYHTTSDCSGPRYLLAADIPRAGYIHGSTLFYGSGPTTNPGFLSFETFNGNQDPTSPGSCGSLSTVFSSYAAPVSTVDLTTLGYNAPFSAR